MTVVPLVFRRGLTPLTVASACCCLLLAATGAPQAATLGTTWTGNTDGDWATAGNWSTVAFPNNGADNYNVAFDSAGNGNTTLTIGTVTINSLIFNTASAAAYVLGSSVGSGALTLTGNNASNPTVVSLTSGVANSQVINSNLGLSDTANGGNNTFTFTNASTLASLTVAGNIASLTSANTMQVNGAGNTVINGAISATTGSLALNKDNAGTLTLAGGNSYTGGTNIWAGVVNIRNDSALGATANGTYITNGAALELQGGLTVAESITFNGYGISGNGSIRSISGDNSLTGSIVLGGANSAIQSDSDTLTITGGINRGSDRELVLQGAGNIVVEGAIDGSNSFSKNGSGTVIFKGANTFTSGFSINAGTLNIQNNGAMGTTGQGTSVQSGGTLALQGGITVAGESLWFGGTGVGGNGALRNVSGSNTWTGGITVDAGQVGRIQSDAGSLTLSGLSYSTNHGSLTIGGASDTAISGSFAPQHWRLGITKDGNGALSLTGANYFANGISGFAKDGASGLTFNGGPVSVAAGTGSADTAATWGTTSNVMTVTSTAGLAVGQPVAGNGIPPSTYIGAIVDATHIALLTHPDVWTTTPTVPTAPNDAAGATFGAWSSLGGAALSVNSSDLNLNGKSHAIESLSMTAGTIGAGSLTAASAYNADAGRIDAALLASGTLGLNKGSTGTLILGGANSYTGTTAVNQGILKLDFATASAPTDNIVNNVANSSALNLGATVNWNYSSYWLSGALQVQGKDGTANTQRFNGVTLAQNSSDAIAVSGGAGGSAALTLGALTRNGGSTVDFSISGTASIATTTGSANALLLGGQNQAYATFNGDTWAVKDGANTTVVGASAGFYTNSTGTTLANHANLTGGDTTLSANSAINTLRFNDNATRTLTIGAANTLTLNNGAMLIADNVAAAGSKITGGSITSGASNNGGRDLIVHQMSAQTFEIASAIVKNGSDSINLYKSGPGTLLLSGASTFTGSTTVSGGTLQVGNASALGASTNSLNLTGGAMIDLHGFSVGIGTLQGAGTVDNLSASDVTLTLGNGSNSGTFAGTIQDSNSGTVAVVKVGSGSWVPATSSTYSGGTTLSAGNVTLTGSTSSSSATILNGPFGTGTLTLAGVTIGNWGNYTIANPVVAQAGTTSVLDNSQGMTFTGNISGTGNITVTSGNPKELWLSGDNSGFGGIFVNNTGGQNNTLRFANANSGSAAGQWSFVKGSVQLDFAGGTIRFGKLDGTVGLNKNSGGGITTIEVGGLNLDGSYSGTISNSNGTVVLAKVGSGTQFLTGTNTYSGGTTISAGTVNINADAALGATAGAVTFAGNGKLQAGAASLVLAAGRGITLNSGVTGTLDTNGNSMSIAGVISGAGNLAKSGAGTLTLGGTSSYAGTTQVNTGTLLVNGALDASGGLVTVGSGATLGGSGAISRPVSVSTGGIFSPGTSPGETTVNNTLSFAAGGIYKWELSGAGSDHIQVNGDLAVTGSPVLRLVNLGGASPNGQVYDFITFTGSLTSSAAWTIDYGSTSTGTTSHWVDGTGNWDTAANWDQAGWNGGSVTYTANTVRLSGITDGPIAPGPTTDVIIAPAASVAVTGPDAPRTIASLVLGDSSGNAHSLTLQAGGPLTVTSTVTVNPSGTLTANAADLSASQLSVSGNASLGAGGTIGTLNLTAGTTTIGVGATPTIATANVSGSGALSASGGSIGALNVSGGAATLALGATTNVTTATVSGGTFTANGGTIGLLTVNTSLTAQVGGPLSVGALGGKGTVNLQNNANLAVGGGNATSTFEGVVSGAGSLTKTGSGTLKLTGTNSYVGATTISAGTLMLGSGVATPPVAGAEVWFDASDATTLQISGGKITQWTSKGTLSLTASQSDTNKQPTVVAAGSPAGLNIVDFGVFHNNDNNSQYLNFSANVADIRSAFVVFKGAGFLLGSSSAYDFHRGGSLADGANLWDGTWAAANILNGQTYINGALVNGTTTGPAAGQFSIVDVITTGNVQSDALALDRTYRAGGQQIGEVLIFNTVLNATDRQAVEAYLTGKWLTGGGGSSSSLPADSPVTVALGATFDVNGATATIGSLAGAGSVLLNGGALSAGQNNSSTAFSGSVSGNAASSFTKIGSGAFALSGSTQAGTFGAAAGTTNFNAGAAVTLNTLNSAATTNFNSGVTGTVGALNVTAGTTTINAGATPVIATANVSAGATLNAYAGTINTLTAPVGSINFGAAATVGTATLTGGAGGAAVNTLGNYLKVTGSVTALPSATNQIVATATTGSFGIKGSDLANSFDGILLNSAGSKVTLTQQIGAYVAGLDVRAWKTNGSGLDQLEGTPYSLTSPSVTPNDSTPSLGGTNSNLSYMTNNIRWDTDQNNEWATSGGLSAAPYPTGYKTNYAVEYRGLIYLAADGTYRFATSSDDRSALWIDPGTSNPSYTSAIVQNRYDQGVTRRQSNQITLTAGYHDIIVRFTQGGGGHGLYVEWDPTGGTAWADIPGLKFFHGGMSWGTMNLPATSVTASATGELALPTGANNLGALALSGVGTQLTLSGATSVTFNGNVTATGTSSVLLSGPSLILTGNIDAIGASDVLTLPAVTLSAPTVTINASGAGTVILSGATTFTFSAPSPSLVISGGLLQVDVTLGSAAITVNGTGHLGGLGTISGPVMIAAGGSLAPGESPGVLTVSNAVTLNYGALLDFDLNTPDAAAGTGGNDLLVIGTTLTLNPGLTLNIMPGVDFGDGLYHLMSFGSLTDNSNGFQSWTVGGLSSGWEYAFSKTAGSIDVTVTQFIPEPATLALLGLGALLVLRRRSR